MSLFGALNSGVSGLSAQAAAMGVISDNISNSNTVGYKGTVSRFSTLVTAAATETSYTPGGVQMHPQALIDQQGLVQSTTNDTAAAISGDGFFIVSAVTNPDTSDERVFTRAGDFYADESGNLRNTAGFYLQGWATDRNGNLLNRSNAVINNTNNSSVSDLQTINIQQTALAAETQTVEIGANLNADQTVFSQPTLAGQNPGGYANASNALAGGFGTIAAGNSFSLSASGIGITGTLTSTFNIGAATTMNDLVTAINTDATLGSLVQASVVNDTSGNPTLQVLANDSTTAISAADVGGTPATQLFSNLTAAASYASTTGTDANGDGDVIDAADTPPTGTLSSSNPSIDHNTITVTVFDNLGTSHDLDVQFLAVGNNRWAYEVSTEDADPTAHSNGLVQAGFIEFNSDGTISDILDASNTTRIPTGQLDANIPIGPIDWALTDVGDPGTNTINFDFGEINSNVGLTQYSSGVDENANFIYDTYFINQDGASTGDFSSVNIDNDGNVIASFANGLQRPIYKIAIGTFEAPNELEAATGNIYRETEDSGSFLMRQAGEDGAGSIVPSSLEASNIDLATEFTTMIVTQRTYSANAKVITTSDDMLSELLQIKR